MLKPAQLPLTAPTNRSIAVFFTTYKIELLLALCWLTVHLFLFSQHGIETSFEARKYIEEADNLVANGTVSTPNFWLYSVQIFLLAAVKKLQAGFLPAMLVQWAFSLWATLRFYQLIKKSSTQITAVVLSLLLIFNITFQTFNCFLQTESLFHSFTILFTCYLLNTERLTAKRGLFVFLFLVLLCFTRPTGLFWFPAASVYLLFRFFQSYSILLKVGISIGATIAFLFFLNVAVGSGGELDLMLPFRDENIICGVAGVSSSTEISTSENPNSLQGLLYYITHNPGQFTKLAWLRTKAFFGLQRDYYSAGHNMYLAVYFYPVYALACYGIYAWFRRQKPLLIYCIALIGITWMSVLLSCDDWHNRFLLTVVPYFYMLSIPAIEYITGKLIARSQHHR